MSTPAHSQCQPRKESLSERLRVNSCQRSDETFERAATRRIETEFEAANRLDDLEAALREIDRIAYSKNFGSARNMQAVARVALNPTGAA